MVSFSYLDIYTCPFHAHLICYQIYHVHQIIFFLAVTTCQSSIRRVLACAKYKHLQHERRVLSATMIQAKWRSSVKTNTYMISKSRIISLQAILRKWRSEESLRQHKVAATIISSYWRRFYCTSMVQKALRGRK